MEQIYECQNCGAVATDQEHVCAPQPVTDRSDYCGIEAGEVCQPMSEHIAYTCETCGRAAERPELVCNPTKAV